MWIYTRRLSLTSRKMTVVKRGYAFTVDDKGILLSSLTPEMEQLLRDDPAWRYEGETLDIPAIFGDMISPEAVLDAIDPGPAPAIDPGPALEEPQVEEPQVEEPQVEEPIAAPKRRGRPKKKAD